MTPRILIVGKDKQQRRLVNGEFMNNTAA